MMRRFVTKWSRNHAAPRPRGLGIAPRLDETELGRAIRLDGPEVEEAPLAVAVVPVIPRARAIEVSINH
jgi:hypothetical protein